MVGEEVDRADGVAEEIPGFVVAGLKRPAAADGLGGVDGWREEGRDGDGGKAWHREGSWTR